MSVWLTIPSAKPGHEAQKCADAWRGMGYSVAFQRDPGAEPVDADLVITQPYEGYAKACNGLIRAVMAMDAGADWFVCAGDDIWPDPNKQADQIANECTGHFTEGFHNSLGITNYGKFGVMQPTGDPWADSMGRMIERIAGSPWIGREFAERTYGGRGPYYEGYTHCFLDNELMDIAKRLGVYWQRPDLTQMHHHWTRDKRPMPRYLQAANSPEHWRKYKAIYESRRAAGFPGHEPLVPVSA